MSRFGASAGMAWRHSQSPTAQSLMTPSKSPSSSSKRPNRSENLRRDGGIDGRGRGMCSAVAELVAGRDDVGEFVDNGRADPDTSPP